MKLYKRKITASKKFTQAMAVIPEEEVYGFADLLDSMGIDYTCEDVQNGVKFIYGIYIGSRESRQIEKYLNQII